MHIYRILLSTLQVTRIWLSKKLTRSPVFKEEKGETEKIYLPGLGSLAWRRRPLPAASITSTQAGISWKIPLPYKIPNVGGPLEPKAA